MIRHYERRPNCTTVVEAWQRMREQYGDDIAQEAALHTIRSHRDDAPGYLIFVAVKLAGAGFNDRGSRNNRKRVAEAGNMVPYNAAMAMGSSNLSPEDRLDLKRGIESMSEVKMDLIRRIIDHAKTRGRKARALHAEALGGPKTRLQATEVLTAANIARYTDRYERGEYVPQSIKRKLGFKDKRALYPATIQGSEG